MKQCNYCGQFVPDDAVKCGNCGHMLDNDTPPRYNTYYNQGFQMGDYYMRNNAFDSGPTGKSRGVCAVLAIALGAFGLQYFYLNRIGGGLLCILLTVITCGLWEFISLIQGILMFCMSNEEFTRKYVDSTSTMPLF